MTRDRCTKVARIDTLTVEAGWRPWIFVKFETGEGVAGYGECNDGRSPGAIAGTVENSNPLLIRNDPRALEMRFWDLIRGTRQTQGGIGGEAIAGGNEVCRYLIVVSQDI